MHQSVSNVTRSFEAAAPVSLTSKTRQPLHPSPRKRFAPSKYVYSAETLKMFKGWTAKIVKNDKSICTHLHWSSTLRLRRADRTLSTNFPTWSPWSTTRTCGTGACSATSTLPPAPIRQRHAQDQALDIDFSCARFRMANEVPTLCGRQHLYQVCSGFVTLMQM